MDITILLALLGVGLLAALAGGGSDDPEPEPVDPTPDDITVVSGQKAFGGGGNDTLTADGPVNGSSVFGGEGDDTITLNATNSELSGGTGNDIITLSGGSDIVYGGEGSDVLTTVPNIGNSGIYGGEGNDTLTLDFTIPGVGPASSYYGGNGDDLFHVDLTLGPAIGGTSLAPQLRGGNGDDIFDISVTLDSARQGSGTAPQLMSTIDDFNPSTDRLILDAQGAGLSLTEAANGSYTDVILTYAANGTMPATQGIIRLNGVSDLDPRLLGLAPDTAPQSIVLESNQNVVGGSGNDTITSNGSIFGTTVSGDDGSDSFDVFADFSRLNGDAGDDLITLHGYHSSIFGGAGNDTLNTGADADYSRLFGGSGNDTFNLDYSTFSSFETPASDGGQGNDRFNVQLTLNIDPERAPDAPDLEGGDGSDVFDLDIQLGNVFAPDADTELERDIATIKDFVPGRDILQIDGHGATVAISAASNGRDSIISVTFPATASDPAVSALITLEDVIGVSLTDIRIS